MKSTFVLLEQFVLLLKLTDNNRHRLSKSLHDLMVQDAYLILIKRSQPFAPFAEERTTSSKRILTSTN